MILANSSDHLSCHKLFMVFYVPRMSYYNHFIWLIAFMLCLDFASVRSTAHCLAGLFLFFLFLSRFASFIDDPFIY